MRELLLLHQELLARNVPSNLVLLLNSERDASAEVASSATVQAETNVPPGQPTASGDRLPLCPGRWDDWRFFRHDSPPGRLGLDQEKDTTTEASANNSVDGDSAVKIPSAPSPPSDDRSRDPVAESSGAASRLQAAEAASSSSGRINLELERKAAVAWQGLFWGWTALNRSQRSAAVHILLERSYPCVRVTLRGHAAGLNMIPTHADPVRAKAALLAHKQLAHLWPQLSPSDQTVHLTGLVLPGRFDPEPVPLAAPVVVKEEGRQREEEENKENRPPVPDKGKARAQAQAQAINATLD
ncbi:hypothetical protein FB45DRAFT_896392 [Roridomyces roridus]|uniref:Uncharacterized protein n=1 Tax=Roridomyces roridus TaxID=1738132 RepID=A0AAD7CAU8_9AGAR|nr:hypothetical protein FB45DRAFT_896392 [Roridomyces roridus]